MTLTLAIGVYAALHLARFVVDAWRDTYPRRCSLVIVGLGVWAGIELAG